MYIEEIGRLIYAIIPEDRDDIVFFHSDLDILMTWIVAKIKTM